MLATVRKIKLQRYLVPILSEDAGVIEGQVQSIASAVSDAHNMVRMSITMRRSLPGF